MFRRPRSFQALLWITSMTILFGWRASDAEAQAGLRPYLVVAVDIDGRMNFVQFLTCGVPRVPNCYEIMQLDDITSGNTMVIHLSWRAAMPNGFFVMVDHTEKTVQVLEFSEPALADYILSAGASNESWETLEIVEEPNPLYPGCLHAAAAAGWLEQALDPAATPPSEGEEGGLSKNFCSPTIKVPRLVSRGFELKPTGATKTVRLYDFVLNREIEVEAEQIAFGFNYEMDMLPWLSKMAGDQQAAALSGASPQGGPMLDLKLVMRSEGTSWVAREAPGAADVFGFYAWTFLAMSAWTNYLQSTTTSNPGTDDMTARMMHAMMLIAGHGMPVETTTKVTIAPGGSSALTAFLPKNAFPSTSSTSKVLGIGRSILDFDGMLPPSVALNIKPRPWHEYGYKEFHSPLLYGTEAYPTE